MAGVKKNRKCDVEGCESQHYGNGFCSKHYQRNKIYGDPLHPPVRTAKTCAVSDCDRILYSGEYCRMHWRRWKRWGDPTIIGGRTANQRAITTCTVGECKNEHHAMGFCAKHYARRASLSHKFNLEWEDYLLLGKLQDWACCGCGLQSKEEDTNVLHVDHDHKTGQVRGLLCGPCNRALGLLKDNTKTLSNLINYLERGVT